MYLNILYNFTTSGQQIVLTHLHKHQSAILQRNRELWLRNGPLREKFNGLFQKIKSLKVENTKLARQNRYLRQQDQGDYSIEKRGYKNRKEIKRYQPKQVNLIHIHPQMLLSSPDQYQRSLIRQNSQLQKENQILINQNPKLQKEVKECIKENKQLKKQNSYHHQKNQEQGDYKIFKRTYRPRRKGLVRNIQCEYPGCERKYSSLIALRNHERQYHGMKLKLKDEKQQGKSSDIM